MPAMRPDRMMGAMGKPILLCYDGSRSARCAIEWAGTFPPGTDAVVSASVGQPGARQRVRPGPGDAPQRRERAVAIADEGVELARAVGLQPRRLVVGTGVNWQSILLVAEEEHARMIVVGARGVEGLEAALGSVSQGVVHHARIPVVVVPPAMEAEADDALAPPDSSSFSRVLARLSGTLEMDALARYVISEAERGRALSEILDDSYVRNRADASTLEQLFDRTDVVRVLGRRPGHRPAELDRLVPLGAGAGGA